MHDDRMTGVKARSWKKVAFFYGMTLLFSGVFEALDLRAPGNITLITGMMWCPALSAVLTQWVFGDSVRGLGWSWGSGRYQIWAYVIPLFYALPVYVIVWFTGLGGFYDTVFVARVSKEFGLSGLPMAAGLIGYFLLAATAGFIPKTARALGEEIGWRGFLVPELAKVTNFAGVGFISGILWAAWHFPSILFGNYNAGTPSWYALTCFTVMVVAGSFIAAWLRLRSRSVWPAAILHGSHNLFIQLILTPVTVDTGWTAYVIDEFGAGLAVTNVIGAIIVWRRRAELGPIPLEPPR